MKKILIVEDDNILAKAFSIALKDEKFDVVVASNGQEALEKAHAFRPDLILLDLIIPIKSGEEVLAEIKRNDELKHIPVLVSTVKSDSDSISRCAVLGMRGYFIKAHYTLDDVVKEVKKVLVE